jgi:hypothetical protein
MMVLPVDVSVRGGPPHAGSRTGSDGPPASIWCAAPLAARHDRGRTSVHIGTSR